MLDEQTGSVASSGVGQTDCEIIHLRRELQHLRLRLAEARLTIERLREPDPRQHRTPAGGASPQRLLGELEVFRSLIENVSDIFTIASADGRFEYLSRSTKLGYEPEELLGVHLVDFIHPDDWPIVAATIARAMAAPRQILSVEHRFLHKSGNWLHMESQGFSDIGPDVQRCQARRDP